MPTKASTMNARLIESHAMPHLLGKSSSYSQSDLFCAIIHTRVWNVKTAGMKPPSTAMLKSVWFFDCIMDSE